VIALLALAAAAAAQAPNSCADPQTQQAINACAATDYQTADAEMNRQWAQIAAQMKARDKGGAARSDRRPGYFQAALAAQRAWLSFRSLQCRAEGYAMRGGSAEPMMVSSCLAGVTRERTRQLRVMGLAFQQ
jgi:uncharacterized protein YecT (DUF1311 family)